MYVVVVTYLILNEGYAHGKYGKFASCEDAEAVVKSLVGRPPVQEVAVLTALIEKVDADK